MEDSGWGRFPRASVLVALAVFFQVTAMHPRRDVRVSRGQDSRGLPAPPPAGWAGAGAAGRPGAGAAARGPGAPWWRRQGPASRPRRQDGWGGPAPRRRPTASGERPPDWRAGHVCLRSGRLGAPGAPSRPGSRFQGPARGASPSPPTAAAVRTQPAGSARRGGTGGRGVSCPRSPERSLRSVR